MSITVMANNGIPNIKAEMDGALFNLFADRTDCVVGGIGHQFNVTSAGSISGLTVTVPSGQALIGGRIFKIEGTETISLNANSVNVLCLRIDLTSPAGTEGKLYINSSRNSIAQQDLNNGGTLRDMAIYEYVTSSSGVTSTTSLRNVKYSSTRSIIQAYGESEVTLTSGVITKCAIVDDSSSQNPTIFRIGYTDMDVHNGGIRVNNDGWYRVNGAVYLIDSGVSTDSIKRVGAYIAKNTFTSIDNELTSQYLNFPPTASFQGLIYAGERIVKLNANDVIYICGRISSGSGNARAGHRWLYVEKIAIS